MTTLLLPVPLAEGGGSIHWGVRFQNADDLALGVKAKPSDVSRTLLLDLQVKVTEGQSEAQPLLSTSHEGIPTRGFHPFCFLRGHAKQGLLEPSK